VPDVLRCKYYMNSVLKVNVCVVLLQNVNTCPVDRQLFTLILVRRCLGGKVIRRLPVEPPRQQDEEEVQEDPTYCEVSIYHVLYVLLFHKNRNFKTMCQNDRDHVHCKKIVSCFFGFCFASRNSLNCLSVPFLIIKVLLLYIFLYISYWPADLREG
jgi:hypothetical protein